MDKPMISEQKFVGKPVEIGESAARYSPVLMDDEPVRMEFKGIRDALVLTDRRMIVIDPQGLRGKKVELVSIPWRSVSAFSVENSGTFDLDAELKIAGSGFGIVEVKFAKGSDMMAIAQFVNGRVFGNGREP